MNLPEIRVKSYIITALLALLFYTGLRAGTHPATSGTVLPIALIFLGIFLPPAYILVTVLHQGGTVRGMVLFGVYLLLILFQSFLHWKQVLPSF